MAFLEIKGLAKKIGKKQVLQDLNFTAEPGKIVGLEGENGAGKSTLIKILASVYKADAGTLSLGGVSNPFSAKWREQVAWVPQDFALDEALTVRDNLIFWASLAPLRKSEREKVLSKAYSDPLIRDFLDKRVAELSGGMKRRANLVCSVFMSGKLILLDEPFAGADEASVQLIGIRLQELVEQGSLLLLISHEKHLLYSLADEVYHLEAGSLHWVDLPTRD